MSKKWHEPATFGPIKAKVMCNIITQTTCRQWVSYEFPTNIHFVLYIWFCYFCCLFLRPSANGVSSLVCVCGLLHDGLIRAGTIPADSWQHGLVCHTQEYSHWDGLGFWRICFWLLPIWEDRVNSGVNCAKHVPGTQESLVTLAICRQCAISACAGNSTKNRQIPGALSIDFALSIAHARELVVKNGRSTSKCKTCIGSHVGCSSVWQLPAVATCAGVSNKNRQTSGKFDRTFST